MFEMAESIDDVRGMVVTGGALVESEPYDFGDSDRVDCSLSLDPVRVEEGLAPNPDLLVPMLPASPRARAGLPCGMFIGALFTAASNKVLFCLGVGVEVGVSSEFLD